MYKDEIDKMNQVRRTTIKGKKNKNDKYDDQDMPDMDDEKVSETIISILRKKPDDRSEDDIEQIMPFVKNINIFTDKF